MIIVIVGIIAVSGVAAYAIRRGPALHGHLVVADGQHFTKIDLGAYRGTTTIGTRGRLCITGTGVLPQHAELLAEPDGKGAVDVIVRPKQGSVSLSRGKNIVHVAIGTPLRDNDLVILGDTRIQYRDLAAGVARLTERRVGP
jgi:hypothetical protein